MLARVDVVNGESPARDEAKDHDEVLVQPLVLVADDDSDFRTALVKTLARLGLRVAEVESGNALI
ncbi:MAG TPA: hypothetical protein VLC93_04235, partial [Myxococcota bacterium]|nr:hypothetical protein [Myxococcota bacterium]